MDTTINDDRLDDCPFCGSPDVRLVMGCVVVGGTTLTTAFAECGTCKAHGSPVAETSEGLAKDCAVECWNTRSERSGGNG